MALPGPGAAEDRQLPRVAGGAGRPDVLQRDARLLDGAPGQPVHRRVRRRAGELPGQRLLRAGRHQRDVSAANLVTESNLADVRDLFLNAGCGGASGYNCTAEDSPDPDAVYLRIYRAAVVLQDDADPTFTTPPAGSLTAGGTLAARRAVVLGRRHGRRDHARGDRGRRPHRRAQVLCSGPFAATCRASRRRARRSRFDTATLADGSTARGSSSSTPPAPTRPRRPVHDHDLQCAHELPARRRAGPHRRLPRAHRTIAYGGKFTLAGHAPPGARGPRFSQVDRPAPREVGPDAADRDATGPSPTASRPDRRARCGSRCRGPAARLRLLGPLNVNVSARPR